MPSGQKVCYRPVFDVETLLTPPPDPFNLNAPAQHKVTSVALGTKTFTLSEVLQPLGAIP